MNEYEIALQIARKAHEGQKDKVGVDYINHPLSVSGFCTSERAKIAAILHDIVEDTDTTIDDLRVSGFGEDIVTAVDCLTKRDGEALDDYYKRVITSDIAIEVKFADMRHNSDMTRWTPENKVQADKNAYKYWRRMEQLYNLVGKERVKNILGAEMHAFIMNCILESYQ